jgi:hypothetical protein
VTDIPEEMVRCPHCRRENLAQATRCVYCGKDLDSFDLEQLGADPKEIQKLKEASLEPLAPFENDPDEDLYEDILEGLVPGQEDPQTDQSEDNTPEWLRRIRERTQTEEDARGIYASKASASAEEGSSRFEAWKRKQEAAREEAKLKEKKPASPYSDGMPNWLKRVRDLKMESWDFPELPDVVHREMPGETREEWTPEELEALRQDVLGLQSELKESQDPGTYAEETADQKKIQESDELPIALLSEPGIDQQTEASPDSQAEEADSDAVPSRTEESAERVAVPEGPQEQTIDSDAADTVLETQTPSYELPVESLPQDELPQELLAADLDTKEPQANPENDLLLLRSQRERAELFRDLLAQEGRSSSTKPLPATPEQSTWHGFIGFLLLAAVLAAMLFIPAGQPALQEQSPQALAFFNTLENLKSSDPLLVVLDYQAATEGELLPVAAQVLKEHASHRLVLLTTQVNANWMAPALLEAAGLPGDTPIAYLPGGSLGILGQGLVAEPPAWLDDYLLNPVPKNGALTQFPVILLISDSGDNLRAWFEQLGPYLQVNQLLALTTRQEAPLMQPYFESGQLAGYIDSSTALVESTAPAGSSRRAYEVGILAMIILLLLGMITKFEQDLGNRQERGLRS